MSLTLQKVQEMYPKACVKPGSLTSSLILGWEFIPGFDVDEDGDGSIDFFISDLYAPPGEWIIYKADTPDFKNGAYRYFSHEQRSRLYNRAKDKMKCQPNVDPVEIEMMDTYYKDKANIQDRFSIKVDWDIDVDSVEGCHGRDLIFDDNPQEVQFYVYKDGGMRIVMGERLEEQFILRENGTLFQNYNKYLKESSAFALTLRAATFLPTVYGDGFEGPSPLLFSADESFYQCYKESQDLNRDLSDQQKAVVERFFDAVKQLFPNDFFFKAELD